MQTSKQCPDKGLKIRIALRIDKPQNMKHFGYFFTACVIIMRHHHHLRYYYCHNYHHHHYHLSLAGELTLSYARPAADG